ncbi:unnamed protein product [Effrenium voratum]|uniref:Uncharacterized protein n=1 Tax=Effrenium voratum TaxID=2562239 RepID=A0AA36J1I8_9DINO|nr:unnamed protein product [Effrenium voratum]CAJ1460008.1 unnamed protein product [Effrenium voratum]
MAATSSRRRGRGACLSFGIALLALLLRWPSTESPFAAHDFAGGAQLKVRPRPSHAGVALRALAAQKDKSAQDFLDLEEVIAKAERVLEDNGAAGQIKAALREAQNIYPGKWTLSGKKDELQQKLREFVEEAKPVLKGLEEDLVLAQAGQDLVLARQRLGLALAQQETAQRQVESAQEQVATAQQQVAMALQTGNAEEVQEAKKEVQEAKKEVQEARKEVQEAKKEVQEAKKEGQEAKKEVQEAKASKTEASGIKEDPDATAFIQELVYAEPKDLGEGVEVFDLKECLPARPYDLSGRKLLTRNTTRQAWKATFELMKNGTERVAMLGIPGIGKSRSLALGLWHLVSGERPDWIKEPQAVVFEAWEGGFVFIFINKDRRWKAQSLPIGKWDASDCEHLQNSNNWYLVDASEKRPTYKLRAKTVKACSPDREHYSNFIKDGGECVYMEAWREQELQVAHGNLATAVTMSTVLERFRLVGGILRILLASENAYAKAIAQQDSEANDFATVQRALHGDLDTMGTKLPSRLFTYLSVDGTSCEVAVCSAGVRRLLARKHYAELVNLWKDGNNPKSRCWLQNFVGVWLTTSWCRKRLETWEITNTGKANASWTHKKGKDFVVPGGLELLQSDSDDTFERRWLQVMKGDLAKRLLRSPELYPGLDYLLDFNHGISVTNSPHHSIKPTFLQRLRDIFDGCKGQHNFTLSFWVTGDPQQFKPKSGAEFNNLMALAQGRGRVFRNVYVQVVQIPKTLDKVPDA